MGLITARSLGAGLALFLCAAPAVTVHAQPARQSQGGQSQGGRLGDMLFDRQNARRAAAPTVARYAVDGSVSFVLDLSTGQPLLRFDGSEEVWALTPQHASRGDVIYKNDIGQTVLRASRLGGLTVFTSGRPEGAAAALRGQAPSLQLRALQNAVAILKRMQGASARAERAAQRPVDFVAPDIGVESAAVLVDAANVTAAAFERIARDEKRGRPVLRRIRQVVFLEGRTASAKVGSDGLVITLVPGRGIAGRPSSERILRALGG